MADRLTREQRNAAARKQSVEMGSSSKRVLQNGLTLIIWREDTTWYASAQNGIGIIFGDMSATGMTPMAFDAMATQWALGLDSRHV